ncbi:MAG: hypothetical protein AB7V00_04660 [Bacilli bacterium]
MKNSLLKKMLREECKMFVPDLKQQVLSQIPKTYTKRKPLWKLTVKQAWSFSLSALLIVFAGITFFGLIGDNTQAFENTVVSVDINPSIELEADENDLVVSYRSMNVDAQLLLEEEGLVLTGKTIDQAVNEVIDLAIEYGYLDVEDVEAEVLITAINQNEDFEQRLNTRLLTKLALLSQNKNIKGEVVLEQADEEMKEQAKDLDMSVGKYILVTRAREASPNLTVSEAAKLSVKQLNEIASGYNGQEIQNFQNAYEQKIEVLTNLKENVLEQLETKEETIVETIDNILEMIDDEVPLSTISEQVDALLTTHFPNVNPANLTTYNRYQIFLVSLKEFTEEQTGRFEALVNTKYDSQVKAFRYQMQGDIDITDFEFVFDDDFEPEHFPDGDLPISNEAEEDIVNIINQVSTYISLIEKNPGKQHGQSERMITALMNQFAALMESPQVSSTFKQSETVQTFLQNYEEYLND